MYKSLLNNILNSIELMDGYTASASHYIPYLHDDKVEKIQ